jgi:hypothetical protein
VYSLTIKTALWRITSPVARILIVLFCRFPRGHVPRGAPSQAPLDTREDCDVDDSSSATGFQFDDARTVIARFREREN